jgi:hypothetical protein
MNMKHYFIDEVNVIIDGSDTQVVTITGSGHYDPNMVKREANDMVREHNKNSKLASVILSHKQVTLEEYQEIIGRNPAWLGNVPSKTKK